MWRSLSSEISSDLLQRSNSDVKSDDAGYEYLLLLSLPLMICRSYESWPQSYGIFGVWRGVRAVGGQKGRKEGRREVREM